MRDETEQEGAAPYDPMAYAGAPGAIPLVGRNIAPDHGEKTLGMIPYGLTAICAENMHGKSRILSAVRAIALKVLKPRMLTMTRGETDASVSLGTSELRVEVRTSGGKERTKVDRHNVDAHGPIEELPDVIEILITGGGHVSEDSNWRSRLQALLAFHPVPVTDARLSKLAGVLPPPDEDIAVEIANAHQASPFPSLLEAADGLGDRSGILQKRAREAEAEAKDLGLDLERQQGRIEEVLRKAAAEAGMPAADPSLRRALLDDSPEQVAAPSRLRHAEANRARLAVRLEDRAAALVERAKLRESHGPRPDVGAERSALADVGPLIEAAREVLAEQQSLLTSASMLVQESLTARRGNRQEVDRRVGEWASSSSALNRSLASLSEGAVPDISFSDCRAALLELERAVAADLEIRARYYRAKTEEASAQRASEEACAALESLLREEERLKGYLAAAEQRVAGWQKTADLIAGPLPEVSPVGFEGNPAIASKLAALVGIRESGELYDAAKAAVLQVVDQIVAELARLATLAAAGAPYRAAIAELDRIEGARDAAQERAERLRQDVTEVWDRLAEIISTAIDSRLVRVGKGRNIEVALEDGRWVDVADDVELSKGRLRRAFLEFYLERTLEGERNVLVEDVIMLPIGPAGRREISARAAAKKIRLLFEQPVEHLDLRVLWYGDGGAA